MRVVSCFASVLAGSLVSANLFVFAQDAVPSSVSDPDFHIQGEYAGDAHHMHVIARGEGEFDIVVYDGPVDRQGPASSAPRRLDGDQDLVEDLAESLDVKRVRRRSPTLGMHPPADAIVLFDGSQRSLDGWKDGKLSADGFLIQGTETKQTFRDYSLHLEFRTPWMPKANGQARGNSGVYHQGRYETQILDSFGLAGKANETGGIYGVKPPDTNACLPPMQWQTYDVDFTAARYRDDKKISNARMTVRLNGVIVQNDVVVPQATTAAAYREGPDDGPIYLQDHGNEVRFRNIWLVPRDAAREASRPIVPGYERFFASATDDKGLGGEILISTLGCTSCHQGASGVLPVKSGPNLFNLRQRVRPDALVAMIADPHKTKRGTTMPDPWMGLNSDQRRAAAESIASFLMLTGSDHEMVDRPAKPTSIKRGEELYHSVGCVACHAPRDGTEVPSATTVPLGAIETKYTVDSLADLIAQPHAIRPGARMPSLVGSKGDAYAIASYLTGSVTRRESHAEFRRRVYKGQWKKLPDFDALRPVSEDVVKQLTIDGEPDQKHTGMVFEASLQIVAPGKYEFAISSDDGSRLIVGPHRIDNDGIHPTVTKRERFELDAGVYPVRVEWFNFEGGVSLDVRVTDPLLGEVGLAEMIAEDNPSTGPLLASRFMPDPAEVVRGGQLFQSAKCSACHSFGSVAATRPEVPEMTALRTDRGCLANSVLRPAVDYHLSPRQKQAIRTAIQLRRESRSSAVEISDPDLVHVTLAGLNCYACHRRGRFGGPETARDPLFSTTMVEMGWEGRLPPPLDGVGDKLQNAYLRKLLAQGADERSYMHTRMPGFGKQHLDLLQKRLTRLDQTTSDDHSQMVTHPANEDELNAGRKLVGARGLSCIKCHSYNNVKGGGIGALDLLTMPKRLRADWFARYLRDPTRYRPGTRMPNSFPEGRSAYTKLYDGDPAKQIHAIWGYLNSGDSVKEPAGLRAGAILLTAGERPRIYRNFFEGVSGRGIAVGFPEELNIIWDAERMGLYWIWKNEFIDAARHWTGRGQGRTKPAGDQIHPLETWTPIVAGDSTGMTWPSESGRELGYRFRGYRFFEPGTPTFQYTLGRSKIQDSIRPLGVGGLERKLSIVRPPGPEDQELVWRIARAATIEPTETGYKLGEVNLTIEGAECDIVEADGQRELRCRVPSGKVVTIIQTIQW